MVVGAPTLKIRFVSLPLMVRILMPNPEIVIGFVISIWLLDRVIVEGMMSLNPNVTVAPGHASATAQRSDSKPLSLVVRTTGLLAHGSFR